MHEENNRKSQLDGLVAVSRFDFSSAGETSLENKIDSFVERKILYRMSLKWSLQYVGKCHKKMKTLCPVYYDPSVIAKKQMLPFCTSMTFYVMSSVV